MPSARLNPDRVRERDERPRLEYHAAREQAG
jgi:hypothetical protein